MSDEYWECPGCDFNNPPDIDNCEMCDEPRIIKTEKVTNEKPIEEKNDKKQENNKDEIKENNNDNIKKKEEENKITKEQPNDNSSNKKEDTKEIVSNISKKKEELGSESSSEDINPNDVDMNISNSDNDDEDENDNSKPEIQKIIRQSSTELPNYDYATPLSYYDKDSKTWCNAFYMGNDGSKTLYLQTQAETEEDSLIVCIPLEFIREGHDYVEPKEDNKINNKSNNKIYVPPQKLDKTEEKNDNKKLNNNNNKSNNKSSNKELQETDEWENVNDFVFGEYIRDVVETIPDLLNNLDKFIEKMGIIGVNSYRSRSRALEILENYKNNKKSQNFINKELTEKEKYLQRRYEQQSNFIRQKSLGMDNKDDKKWDMDKYKVSKDDKEFSFGDPNSLKCGRCEETQKFEWDIYHLQNCQHGICLYCFKKDIKKYISNTGYKIKKFERSKRYRRRKKDNKNKNNKLEITGPVCQECQIPILINDIELFLNEEDLASKVEKLLEYNNKKTDLNDILEDTSDNEKDKKRKRKKRKRKKHKDSDSDSSSGSSSSGSSDDSDYSSSDSDDDDPYYHCFNIEEECDGQIKKSRKRKKKFTCPKCKLKNCLKCKTIHDRKENCESYKHIYRHPFLKCWTDKKTEKKRKKIEKLKKKIKKLKKKLRKYDDEKKEEELKNLQKKLKEIRKKDDKKKENDDYNDFDPPLKKFPKKMCEAHPVKRDSKEWRKVIGYIQDGQHRNITRIERIQNRRLWRNYEKFGKLVSEKKKMPIQEMYVWHGTRQTPPEQIWSQNGFDLSFSRVGGCLWYAVQNSYSMGGYQHVRQNTGENQVFLATVITGDPQSCVFKSGRSILNVYQNAATYPAYLVSWR